MWPWGHAALGYVLYSLWSRYRRGQSPNSGPAIAVVFGAVLSDLIDKPLAWSVGVLSSGRSLGHSLLLILPVVGVLWWIADDRHRGVVAALGFGWCSHLVGDGLNVERLADLGYALWPVTRTPEPDVGKSFAAHVEQLALSPFLLFQFGLVVAAFVVWRADGYPGLGLVVDRIPAALTSRSPRG